MSQVFPAVQFRVQEDIFDSKSMLDETNFYLQKQGTPSELSKRMTYIVGRTENNYPLTLATIGAGGYGKQGGEPKRTKELADVQFTYPVMGKGVKVPRISKTIYDENSKPGIGNSDFYLYFPDNWLKRFYIIQSTNGVQAYIRESGELQPDGHYRYQCVLDPASPADYCDWRETQPGVAWIDVTTNVAESESRTTESNMVMPGLFKNQMGFMRHGMSWAGNAPNKVMRVNITIDGVNYDLWMDWFMWQFEQKWNKILENAAWYSRYNRRADGTITLKDLLTGKVIPRGSGVLEQIPNRSTYAELEFESLVNKMGDALFAQTNGDTLAITLMGGRGARREMDRAVRKAGGQILTSFQSIGDKFITGSGYNLMLGGYFDGFYHIDGYIVKFKYNPVFDFGEIAQAGPKHPVTGFPLESYRMVFIDDNDYEGESNIQHVAQEGRSFLHGIVPGLTDIPRSLSVMDGSFNVEKQALKILSTDMDKGAYTRMTSAGWQIKNASRCFDIQCVAGLPAA